MKTNLIILIMFLASLLARAQIVNIPDANFKDALVNHPTADLGNGIIVIADTNGDGEIQISEAEAVQKLYVSNFFINTIEGIQEFINLIELQCAYNNIAEVDVSQNLFLEYLNFRNNQLSNLNVSQNQSIEFLDFANNYLTSIDISQNNNLITLFCDGNQLSNLDTSQNLNLELVQCNENQFTSLSFVENPNLIFLSCSFNNLSILDVSQNILLETFYCYNNQLSNIDVSQNQFLKILNFRYNQISNIDVSNNTYLQLLTCNNNEITSIDISQNPYIYNINCSENELVSLNLKNGYNNILTSLRAYDNPNLTCIQVDDVAYANNQPNWHKDETAIYSEDCNLGVTEQSLQESVQLYPNPVKNTLQISTENGTAIKSIKVFDILGKRLLQNHTVSQIDVSAFANGLLFVKIETDKGIVVKKVVKE